jgi:hypothetical protein
MLGDVLATMIVAHYVGDYWVQSDHQATTKGHDAGQCAAHVATYCLTQALFLTAMAVTTGWRPYVIGVLLALAITAATHYIADRRAPLRWMAIKQGKAGFVERGGLPLLD